MVFWVCVEYMYTKKIKIERTRTFHRFLERKKASFEVFHYRGMLFGLTGRRVSLGKCLVKMDGLLGKCEVHEVLEVCFFLGCLFTFVCLQKY